MKAGTRAARTLRSPLRGPVDVTDVYGNRTRADPSTLHPTELSPLIVEPALGKRRAVR